MVPYESLQQYQQVMQEWGKGTGRGRSRPSAPAPAPTRPSRRDWYPNSMYEGSRDAAYVAWTGGQIHPRPDRSRSSAARPAPPQGLWANWRGAGGTGSYDARGGNRPSGGGTGGTGGSW